MKKMWRILLICMLSALLCACGNDAAKERQSEKKTADSDSAEKEETTRSKSESEQDTDTENGQDTDTESKNEPDTEINTQPETEPEPEVTTKPEPVYTYTDVNKTMYATTSVNMRSGPDADFDKTGTLSLADEFIVTGVCNETGWYRGQYNGNTVYVSDKYLSETKPEVPTHITYYDTGDAALNEKCDAVLNQIADTDMTEREIAYAIYKWVETNVVYQGATDSTDWVKAANTALSTRKGNCIAFYSVARALLTRAGFENTVATSYTKDHYWNMVKVEGSWWHFDCTAGWQGERFLWTTKQINEYRVVWPSGHVTEYNFNPEGCPETP